MQCLFPVTIKTSSLKQEISQISHGLHGSTMLVPCGKCIACRINKSKEWSVRLLYEAESHVGAMQFVTLTYDNEHLPLDLSLDKRELQLYFKRLRKDISCEPDLKGVKIKYFACGEYGENFHRPHYHFILFGLPDRFKSLISDNWCKGFVKIGFVSIKSINYVTGYVLKKYGGDKAAEEYGSRLAPFQLCSQGLGLDVFKGVESNRASKRGYLTVNGVKRSIPRYYIKKLDMSLPGDSELLPLSDSQRIKNAEGKMSLKQRGNL